MNQNPVRWGILGTANIARRNWQAIHNSGNSVLTGVASRDRARSERFIDECQAHVPLSARPHAFGSYEALLASADVDAVYIPLPTGIRREWVIGAAEAGKHVVCEKPCGVTFGELLEMTDVCRHHGVQFMDGVMFVHGLRWQRLKELLAEGSAIGEVRRISSQFSFLGDADFFANNMRALSTLEPQGCLGDLGWYSLVFTLEVLDGRMPQAVTGRVHSELRHPASPAAVPTEFSGELHYTGGVSSSFYCSFLTENQQWASISGTKGHLHLADFVLPFHGGETTFEVNQPEFRVSGCQFDMISHARRVVVPEHSNNHPTSQETNLFRHFANQVASGALNDTWPERALKTQRLMDACLESARNGSRLVAVG